MITLKQPKNWCENGNTTVILIAEPRSLYTLDHNFGIIVT